LRIARSGPGGWDRGAGVGTWTAMSTAHLRLSRPGRGRVTRGGGRPRHRAGAGGRPARARDRCRPAARRLPGPGAARRRRPDARDRTAPLALVP